MTRSLERGSVAPARRSPSRPAVPNTGSHQREMNRRSALIEQLSLPHTVRAPERHTLHEALERFREEHLFVAGLAESTVTWMERYIRVLDRRAGRLDLSIRWRPIAAAIHRELAPSAAMFACYLLGRVLRCAQGWGWRAEPHDLQGLCSIKTGTRKRVLTLPERLALMKAHEATATPRRKVCSEVILLLLHTGWRCGEACALRWDTIDLRTGEAFLPHTKTGPQTRTVGPEALKIVSRQPRTHAWVFPNRKGDGSVKPQVVYLWWRVVADRLGIKGACVHTLRTTFCTVAAQLHIHPSVIASAVGHTSEFQTMRYTHVNPDDVRAAASTIASRLQGVG